MSVLVSAVQSLMSVENFEIERFAVFGAPTPFSKLLCAKFFQSKKASKPYGKLALVFGFVRPLGAHANDVMIYLRSDAVNSFFAG